MSIIRNTLTITLLVVLCSSVYGDVAQWDFNGDLESVTGQGPLIEGAAAPEASAQYTFEDVKIGDEFATVAQFTRGTFFRLQPGFPPNGGGQYVNQYTLIMDVMFPDRSPSGGWAALMQTNENNANDADWFVNPTDGLGIDGNYGGSVPAGEWHRIALVVDLVAGTYTSYVDGVQVQQNTGQARDGRFSLYSVNDGPIDGIMLFADESQDNAEGSINSVQFRDVALPASEILALGGATAEGIPVPTDPRDCAFRNFSIAYDVANNKVTGTWSSIAGDQGFRVFEGARQIGGDLPANATSFEDLTPPKGGVKVTYTLKPLLSNGTVERECASNPVDTFLCLSGVACCADQGNRTVTVSWTPPINADVEGYEVRRNGALAGNAPAAATSFADSQQAAGIYEYAVAPISGGSPICAGSCRVLLTGVDAGGTGACDPTINQYDFEDDLTSSTGGRDLVPGISTPIDVGGAPSVTFETADIDGSDAKVARYSRGTIFKMYTALPANGGGIYTNRYTLIMDVMFEPGALDESGWASLYQTNDANANDGDWFVRGSDRALGIGGVYGGLVEDGEWNRLVLVCDMSRGTLKGYVNGQLAHQGTDGIDGRFALYTIDQGASEGIFLFADESGDNSAGLVNSVQIRDAVLSEDEIAAFGRPLASGIPYVPPCPHQLTVSLDAAARSAALSWKLGPNAAATAIVIRRDGQDVAELPLSQTSYVDSGLSAGAHVYEVSFKEKDSGCVNLPLLAQVEVPASGYLFFESFDAYDVDGELTGAGWEVKNEGNPAESSAWTVENPGALKNPPSFNGRPTSGRFAVSDSSFGGATGPQNSAGSGASYDLWSPSFSAAGNGPVWLHFDAVAQLNDDGDAVFDVDVSTDGGTSWTNVLRRISPSRLLEPLPQFGSTADGLYGRVHLDLGAAAGGSPTVRLRFRHFEPTHDWWVAVDNVLVDRNPPGGAQTPLPVVNFSGGIPATWGVVAGTGSDQADTWSTNDDCSLSIGPAGTFPDRDHLHHLESPFALVDPFCTPVAYNEYLITPELDLSAESRVFLHFQSAVFLPLNALAEVIVSVDGGGTYEAEPVFSYTLGAQILPGEEPLYNQFSIEVPAAARKPNVVFAFHFQTLAPSGSVTTGWWAVDSVSVTSSRASAGPLFRRGDGDGSGAIDITDAINNLSYQFLGSFVATCRDALDDDDSGSIDISDPVFSLARQFLGGPAWPAPYPDCGPDETPDLDDLGNPGDLGCQSQDACN